MIEQRIKTYFNFNTQLSTLSTSDIHKLLKESEVSRGWGINHLINFSGKKIFIKRIPLTQLEFENQFSTKNLFNLPTFYNYGVGSAGFGAFRELSTHIKTTNWVLNQEIENFPLMYHYRIVSKKEKNKPIDKNKHKKYIKYWNSNKNIDRYVLSRKQAKYEIVLFLEYIPYTAKSWLIKNTDKFELLTTDMKRVTTFLKSKGLIHFDMHLANILVDGKTSYLTDFGLCLDRSFELSQKEIVFFKDHFNYDYDEFISCLSLPLTEILGKLPQRKQDLVKRELKIPQDLPSNEVLQLLLNNIEKLKSIDFIKIDKNFLSFLKKHKRKILSMTMFYKELRATDKKNIKY